MKWNLFLSETLAGRYRPRAHLGSGGFAGVFLAEDGHTQERVATKILKLSQCSSSEALIEFRGEVNLLGKLRGCDHVIHLLDSGEHTVNLHHPHSGGVIAVKTEFAVLELAAGSLADLLMYGRAFSWPDRLRLYRDVVKGVHQMHLHRIVHRDIKAENGLVIEGRRPVAKAGDLGRSHDTSEPPRFAIEAYLLGRGDTHFAPFEFLWLQGTQKPDDQALADLFLLGSLLFEIATGVSFTSLVTVSPVAVIHEKAALPEQERERDWRANMPLLREAARPALETLARELPTAIAARTLAVVAQLTDPDPNRRLPLRKCGRGAQPDAWNLEWLLERIDGLRRAIDPDLRRRYIAERPHLQHGRPRSRAR